MLCYNIMDPQHTQFSYLMSPNSIKGGFHNRLFSTRIICIVRHGAFYFVELMIQVPKHSCIFLQGSCCSGILPFIRIRIRMGVE
jgi:hypothetical protein